MRPDEPIEKERQRVVKVTKKLWMYGYRAVSLYGLGLPFNCLVGEKFKVKVGKDDIKTMPKGIDFYVYVPEDSKPRYYKKHNSECLVWDFSPLRIIPK